MALQWIVDNGRDVKTNFARVSLSDTLLVNNFHPPFVQAIEDFFNNNPLVKNYSYIISGQLAGGIRSVEKQNDISPSSFLQVSGRSAFAGASGGRSAHNYGMAIDFAPVGPRSQYQQVFIGSPYTRHPGNLLEPYAAAVQALYNHPTLLSGATFSNLNDYLHIEWRDYRNLARNIAPQYWRGVGPGSRQSYAAPERLSAPVTTPRGPGISPFIAANESFHPHIQYELSRRRVASETANSHMPFVKLTSLVKVYNANLQTGEPSGSFGAYCPSLGVHGEKLVGFDTIYYPADGRSIVGYATRETTNGPEIVPVMVESSDEDPPNIPTPGIVSISSERNTAGGFGIRGGLFRATINIRAYSLGQTNTLLKYFIRQGTRVVLEIGRNSSSPAENILMYDNSSELTTFRSSGLDSPSTSVKELFQKFNWKRPQREIDAELGPLIRLETGQKEFIERYTYNNFGNYEVFIGYVASFKMKYTKENVYDIELTVHSVQQFEVPIKLGGTRSAPTTITTVANPCEPIDIMEYFNPDAAFRENSFTRVLAKCVNPEEALYQTWGAHVIPLRAAGAQAGSGGSKSNGYLLSWECFVDLILNDTTYGLLGTFQLQQGLDNSTLSTLRSGVLSRIGSTAIGNPNHINSNEVSWNAQLRSTDINTMIIHNRIAQLSNRQDYAAEVLGALRGAGDIKEEDLAKIESGVNDNTIRSAIENNGAVKSFDDLGKNTSYLTNGVWINSNAIAQAFSPAAGADTISAGITNLLNAMNNATQGYWNLQLLSAEPEALGLRVIDAGLSKPVDKPLLPQEGDFAATLPTDSPTNLIERFKQDVAQFTNASGSAEYLYVFNRKLQKWYADDLGSELLDVNIDYSMPNVIAVQVIAGVGGIAQRGTLSAINVDELKAISMFDTYPSSNPPPNPTCADAPTAYADKNTNNTLSVTQMGRIVAAISVPQVFEQQGGLEGVIKTIETEAFERWKTQNDAKQESERETEDAARQKIKEDIESARRIVADSYESRNPGMIGLVRSYASTYGKAIDLVENNISKIVSLLDRDREDNEIHPFNASNLTKTIVDLTIPGIGGILLFQAFTIDRVPNILRRGYYIVTKVNHEFSADTGWVTKIQGRFRFKPKMTGDTRS